MPSEAMKEILDDPSQMAFDIMELRAYAAAKEALDNAKRPEDLPTGPMVEKVWIVQHELVERQKEGK